MTTYERQTVRGCLLAAGFRRETSGEEPNHYDIGRVGIYTEVWRHTKDRTKITLEWDRKTDPVKPRVHWTVDRIIPK